MWYGAGSSDDYMAAINLPPSSTSGSDSEAEDEADVSSAQQTYDRYMQKSSDYAYRGGA